MSNNQQHHEHHPEYVHPPHAPYSAKVSAYKTSNIFNLTFSIKKVEAFLKQNHVNFEDAGAMKPNVLLQPMHPANVNPASSQNQVNHMLHEATTNHGQMQTTLHQTEAKYDEIAADMNDANNDDM